MAASMSLMEEENVQPQRHLYRTNAHSERFNVIANLCRLKTCGMCERMAVSRSLKEENGPRNLTLVVRLSLRYIAKSCTGKQLRNFVVTHHGQDVSEYQDQKTQVSINLQ